MEKTINIRVTFKVSAEAPENPQITTLQEFFETAKEDLIKAIRRRLESCQKDLLVNQKHVFEITEDYIKYRILGFDKIGQYNLRSADAMESAINKLIESNYNFTWDELFQMNKAVASVTCKFTSYNATRIRTTLLNMLYVYSNR